MKRFCIYFCALCILGMAACGPNRSKELEEIQKNESALMANAQSLGADPTSANNMINLYLQFANDFPTDSLTPDFLLKAGDIAFNFGKTDTALMCFNQVIENHPSFTKMGDAYLLRAMTYEASQDYDNARKYYQLFVDKYPQHPVANDIKMQLDNQMIGMSPEEMLSNVLKEHPEAAEELK